MKGKGAQYNPDNPYGKYTLGTYFEEGIDENVDAEIPKRQIFYDSASNVISRNKSPDLNHELSVNPYQGCEHGCVYCYARNTHPYWGFSAGLDFESKIIVKKNAPELLKQRLINKNWVVRPILISGNTDCYQPLEQKMQLTRNILKVMLQFRHPVSIITKNSLILRDLDILTELAKYDLVHVYISVTSMDEKMRSLLEPRTSTTVKRLETVATLSDNKVPVGVMLAPIIPGINHHDIPAIMKSAAQAGAKNAGYTVIRLNGQVKDVFEDWLKKKFPERANKVLNQIGELHGGSVSDLNWGRRIKGAGHIAEMIEQLFKKSFIKYIGVEKMPKYNIEVFRRNGVYNLFD